MHCETNNVKEADLHMDRGLWNTVDGQLPFKPIRVKEITCA